MNRAQPALKPKSQQGRLFCRTLIPHDYRLILHGDGEAQAFDPTGRALGAVQGNSYHRNYGQNVVQIDPVSDGTKTVFLHVLTATDAEEMDPPRASYRISGLGRIEVTVDEAKTSLAVPQWFTRSD